MSTWLMWYHDWLMQHYKETLKVINLHNTPVWIKSCLFSGGRTCYTSTWFQVHMLDKQHSIFKIILKGEYFWCSMNKRSVSNFPGELFVLLVFRLLFCCCCDLFRSPVASTPTMLEHWAKLTCWGGLPPEHPPSPTAQCLALSKCSLNGRFYLDKPSLDQLEEASSVRKPKTMRKDTGGWKQAT